MDGLSEEMLSKLKLDKLTVEEGLLSLFDGLGSLVNVILRMLKEYGGEIEACHLFYDKNFEAIIPQDKMLISRAEKNAQDNEFTENIDKVTNDIEDDEIGEALDQEDDFNLGKETSFYSGFGSYDGYKNMYLHGSVFESVPNAWLPSPAFYINLKIDACDYL